MDAYLPILSSFFLSRDVVRDGPLKGRWRKHTPVRGEGVGNGQQVYRNSLSLSFSFFFPSGALCMCRGAPMVLFFPICIMISCVCVCERESIAVYKLTAMLFDGFYMQRRQREQCTMLRSAILDLMDWRLQLMTGTFTLDHLRDLRMRITSHIDSGNRYVTFFFYLGFSRMFFFYQPKRCPQGALVRLIQTS